METEAQRGDGIIRGYGDLHAPKMMFLEDEGEESGGRRELERPRRTESPSSQGRRLLPAQRTGVNGLQAGGCPEDLRSLGPRLLPSRVWLGKVHLPKTSPYFLMLRDQPPGKPARQLRSHPRRPPWRCSMAPFALRQIPLPGARTAGSRGPRTSHRAATGWATSGPPASPFPHPHPSDPLSRE